MNPFNARVRAILRREFMQRVRSRWFLLSTIGVPILFAGLSWFSVWMMTGVEEGAARPRVGIVDRSGRLADAVARELEAETFPSVAAPELRGLPEDSLRDRLLSHTVDLFVVLPADLLEARAEAAGNGEQARPEVRVLSRRSIGPETRRALRDAVDRAVVRERLQAVGIRDVDTRSLLREARVDVIRVSEEGAQSQEAAQIGAFILALVFYGVLLFYGQMIVRSIVEEKTSDIVEVMVSSVRPRELMLGKIVGVGAVGLVQLGIWGVIGGLAFLYGLTGGAAALAEAGVDVSTLSLDPWLTLGILTFLVLGYLLYAGLFAGTGATLSNEQDAQQASLPVIILIVVPFLAAQGVIENPAALWSVALSLVPFFSPLLMPSRMLVMGVPAWEIAAALALLVATILLVAWIAGRIYRVGILMKGQRPNLPQLLRWVRHG